MNKQNAERSVAQGENEKGISYNWIIFLVPSWSKKIR